MQKASCVVVLGALVLAAGSVVVGCSTESGPIGVPGTRATGDGAGGGSTTLPEDGDGNESPGADPGTDEPAPDPGSDDAGSGGADAGDPGASGALPDVFQDFAPWQGALSPDGIWRIAGDWVGTGGNMLVRDNATLTDTYAGEASRGFLSLVSTAKVLRGGEIQTVPAYGYGYYEVRMKVASEPGVCDSFFWIQGGKDSYGPLEWDVEFLTNESWIRTPDKGKVHLTVHFQGDTWDAYIADLPFNPAKAFHRYGFLWKTGQMDFTVDGKVIHTFKNAGFTSSRTGVIMMNSWTGNKDWGGGPPTNDATTVYDWVKFYKDAPAIP